MKCLSAAADLHGFRIRVTTHARVCLDVDGGPSPTFQILRAGNVAGMWIGAHCDQAIRAFHITERSDGGDR